MKRSRKESAYLRALLGPEGPDGEILREFGKPLGSNEQKAVRRELAAQGGGAPSSQVQEMREAAGVREKKQAKGVAAQVAEMRQAAAPLFPAQ